MSTAEVTVEPDGDEPDTYQPPLHGWTCFHCGQTFHTFNRARDHFGGDPMKEPACRIEYGEEMRMLIALRKAEEELDRYRAEDSDADRLYHAQQAQHLVALRREEERGYDRGVLDARAHARPDIYRDAATYLDSRATGEDGLGEHATAAGFRAAAEALRSEAGRMAAGAAVLAKGE